MLQVCRHLHCLRGRYSRPGLSYGRAFTQQPLAGKFTLQMRVHAARRQLLYMYDSTSFALHSSVCVYFDTLYLCNAS